jgi:hypothetical protein
VIADVPFGIEWPSFAANCIPDVAADGSHEATSTIHLHNEIGVGREKVLTILGPKALCRVEGSVSPR